MSKSELKEPTMPSRPSPFEYDATVETKYIYSYYVSVREDEGDDDDDDDNDEENRWRQNLDEPIKEVTLLWLMERANEHGVGPEEIKMQLGDDSNCMSFDGYYVRFYYEVPVPAKKKEYAAAMKQHKADMAQYRKDREKYDQAKHLETIGDLERQLARLKSEKRGS